MHVGEMRAAEVWTDVLGWEKGEVTIEQDGFGNFICTSTSVSTWLTRMPKGETDWEVVSYPSTLLIHGSVLIV